MHSMMSSAEKKLHLSTIKMGNSLFALMAIRCATGGSYSGCLAPGRCICMTEKHLPWVGGANFPVIRLCG